MAVDFLQFAANFLILSIIIRVLQGKLAGTEWGRVLAFIH